MIPASLFPGSSSIADELDQSPHPESSNGMLYDMFITDLEEWKRRQDLSPLPRPMGGSPAV